MDDGAANVQRVFVKHARLNSLPSTIILPLPTLNSDWSQAIGTHTIFPLTAYLPQACALRTMAIPMCLIGSRISNILPRSSGRMRS